MHTFTRLVLESLLRNPSGTRRSAGAWLALYRGDRRRAEKEYALALLASFKEMTAYDGLLFELADEGLSQVDFRLVARRILKRFAPRLLAVVPKPSAN